MEIPTEEVVEEDRVKAVKGSYEQPNFGEKMTDVVLACTLGSCTLGVGGTIWKTPSMPAAAAAQYVQSHVQSNHGAGAGDGGGGARSKLQKIERPKLSSNCSQQDFEFFREEWRMYL